MTTRREVELLFKARNEASAEVEKLRGELEKTNRASRATNDTFRQFKFPAQIFTLASQMRVAIDGISVATKAVQGDWEGVRDTLFRLPFGLGQVSRGLDGIIGSMTGWRREIELIEAATRSTEASMRATSSIRGLASAQGDRLRDARNAISRREEIDSAGGIDQALLRQRFADEDAVESLTRSTRDAIQRLREEAAASIDAVVKGTAFDVDSELGERLIEYRQIADEFARGERMFGLGSKKRAELDLLEKEFERVDASRQRISRLSNQQIEELQQELHETLVSMEREHGQNIERVRNEHADRERDRIQAEIDQQMRMTQRHTDILARARLESLVDRDEIEEAERERIEQEFDRRYRALQEIIDLEEEGSQRRIEAEERINELIKLRESALARVGRVEEQQQAERFARAPGSVQARSGRFITRVTEIHDPGRRSAEQTERNTRELVKATRDLKGVVDSAKVTLDKISEGKIVLVPGGPS